MAGLGGKNFGQENEAILVERLRNSEFFINELSLVAEEKGEIVGHLLISKIEVEYDSGRIFCLSLAPVSVAPEHQNKGIGTRMTEDAIAIVRQFDFPGIIVVGHPEYYPRFGFKPARPDFDVPFPVPDEAFMVLPLGELPPGKGMVIYPQMYMDCM